MLLESHSNGEGEDFQECSDQVEDHPTKDKQQEPMIPLHVMKGSQGLYTMRFEALVGNTKVIVLVYSGSTHNFLDTRLC